MSCQNLKIIRSRKNPDFQHLLKSNDLKVHFCLENIGKSWELTSSKGSGVLISLCGGETSWEAAMPGPQVHITLRKRNDMGCWPEDVQKFPSRSILFQKKLQDYNFGHYYELFFPIFVSKQILLNV